MIKYIDIENVIAQRRSEIGDTASFVGSEKICRLSQIVQGIWQSKRALFNLYYRTEYWLLNDDNMKEPVANYSYFARGISGIEVGLLKFSFGEVRLIRFKERILKIWFNDDLLSEVNCSWGLNCLGRGTGKVSIRGSEFFTFKTGLLHVTFPQYKDVIAKMKIKDFLMPLVIRPKTENIRKNSQVSRFNFSAGSPVYTQKGILFREDASRLNFNFEESIVILAISAWLSGINTN